MTTLAVIIWVFISTLISTVPLIMMKNDKYLNGRDLFFFFLGMVEVGAFNIVFIIAK